MNPATQSFRDHLSRLDQAGELLTLSQPVSPQFELGACLSILDDGPALQFADVVDSDLPVVGNILNSRERMAAALGVDVADIEDAIAASATAIGSRRPAETARVTIWPRWWLGETPSIAVSWLSSLKRA